MSYKCSSLVLCCSLNTVSLTSRGCTPWPLHQRSFPENKRSTKTSCERDATLWILGPSSLAALLQNTCKLLSLIDLPLSALRFSAIFDQSCKNCMTKTLLACEKSILTFLCISLENISDTKTHIKSNCNVERGINQT